MRYSLTPAVERALERASAWKLRGDNGELETVALLVGLLAEPECRAAVKLACGGVDSSVVRENWPDLVETPHPEVDGVSKRPLSSDVQTSIHLAADRLFYLPQPLELATEHLLFGLVAADHEVGVWLRGRGFDPDLLEAEIRGRWGEGTAAGSGVQDVETPQDDDCGAPKKLDDRTSLLRILDAAANRAREGLRVVEDFLRFTLDDRHLTHLCKQLRHDLTEALSCIPTSRRFAARDTQSDVGTTLDTRAEHRRDGAVEVLRANFARLQESLRSLEEFSKAFASCADTMHVAQGESAVASAPAAFKQLRYRVYTLERAAEMTCAGIERLASVRLYVLIDGRSSVEEFERLVRTLAMAGVDMIQLRDKRLGDRTLLERARMLRSILREPGFGTRRPLWIMNDRADLAALAQADGVHVGQEEISVKDARTIVGPDALVGVSIHDIEQARRAVLDGADYIGVGPTFPSETKRFERFPGVKLLRTVAAEIRTPAFAIGGITRENLDDVLSAGFTRVAVSGAVLSAGDPAQAVRELRGRITSAESEAATGLDKAGP